MKPCATATPNGPSAACRGSMWWGSKSNVRPPNAVTRSWVIGTHPDSPISAPTCSWAREMASAKELTATPLHVCASLRARFRHTSNPDSVS